MPLSQLTIINHNFTCGGYTLKTIPCEDFSGYRLLAYYYVSWKMAFPDHLKDIGLPFDDAYALAVQMRGR